MTGAFQEFFRRSRDLFRRRRLEAELAEELRAHLEMQEAFNRAAGVPVQEAGLEARRQLGNVERLKEECRDEWSFVWLEQLKRDAVLACRSLAKAPSFVVAVVGTLAIAIGATAAIVNVALQVLDPSLPFADPRTLLVVQQHNKRTNETALMTASQFASFRMGTTAFESLAVLHPEQTNLVVDGQLAAVKVAWVTSDFFGAFGVAPICGRTFAADEYLAVGGGAVAVLTHRVWETAFGGDPAVLGRTFLLGGRQCRVIGVRPESFFSPIGFPAWEVFVPTTAQALAHGDWWKTLVWSVGRLKPGVSPAQAEAELAAIRPSAGLPPEAIEGVVPQLVPVRTLYRSDRDRVIAVLFGAAGFLFVMACANAFNLVFMRTVGRRLELGVRVALGGCRQRLFQLLVIENLLLIGVAGLAASLLAWWFCSLLAGSVYYWWPTSGPISARLGTLWLLVGLAMFGALVVVGIVPACCAMWTAGPRTIARQTGSLSDGRPFRFWRAASAVAQAALAVVLLVGAALCIQTLVHLRKAGVGFDPERRVAVLGQLPQPSFTEPPPTDAYLAQAARLQEELAQLPGVERSALVSRVPLLNHNEFGVVRIADRSAPTEIRCSFIRVSPEYFATLGQRLLSGPGFAGMRRGDPGVVVINETMAREYFPGENPLDCRLDTAAWGQWHAGDGRNAPERETWKIVGVVADVRDEGQRITPRPQCYTPFWQRNPYDVQSVAVLLQLHGPMPGDFAAAVRKAAFAVDPRLVISDVVSLAELAQISLQLERCTSATLGFVSAIALVLAGTGLFSVLSRLVSERQQEFGVRMALGATPGGLQWSVLRRGLRWTGLGVAIGLGASWALTRILQILLYATSPHDPKVFAGVALFVFVVASFACWLPARRAARIDPMIALRAE